MSRYRGPWLARAGAGWRGAGSAEAVLTASPKAETQTGQGMIWDLTGNHPSPPEQPVIENTPPNQSPFHFPTA